MIEIITNEIDEPLGFDDLPLWDSESSKKKFFRMLQIYAERGRKLFVLGLDKNGKFEFATPDVLLRHGFSIDEVLDIMVKKLEVEMEGKEVIINPYTKQVTIAHEETSFDYEEKGKKEKIDRYPKEPWKSNNHFSEWLYRNIDFLSETLGFKLTRVRKHQRYEDEDISVVAFDNKRNKVVVVNQQYNTKNNKFSQLVNIAFHVQASKAVLIVPSVTEKDNEIIDRLNENLSNKITFYLVKGGCIPIDGRSEMLPILLLKKSSSTT